MDNSGRPIKVLVVDDSSLMRKIITDVLNSDKRIRVIDAAKNGLEALQKINDLNPDVVTLDIEMPEMDGFTCLKEILKSKYIPVLMLSSRSEKEAGITIKALELGAVDFISKPKNIFDLSEENIKKDFIEKIIVAGRTTVHKNVESRKVKTIPKCKNNNLNDIKSIVVIGSSTGGPKSLKEVVSAIPGNISAAFLIVQHMPRGFTKSLAERLNSESELNVKEAENGEIIKPGFAYLAPGDFHLLLQNDIEGMKIKLTGSPPIKGLRPSINKTLESLSDTGFNNVIAVIMTGMGNDGSEGIRYIKENNNGYIIAQDESSSIVFGMPKAAISTGLVDKVVPLDLIAEEIINVTEVLS